MKLNLGCGTDYRAGYINVDNNKYWDVKTDLTFDLESVPYPFKSNSISEVLLIDVLEHLNNPLDVMREVYRVCEDGALIKISVPHFSSITAWNNLDHKRPYGVETMSFLAWTKMFSVKSVNLIWKKSGLPRPLIRVMNFLINKNVRLSEAFCYYIFGINSIEIELITTKGR